MHPQGGCYTSNMTRITFETGCRYDLTDVPVQVSIPFAEGAVRFEDLGFAAILDAQKNSLPAQFQPTAFHADGSIRFLHCSFLAPFAGNKQATFTFDTHVQSQPEFESVSLIQEKDKSLWLSNGLVSCHLAAGSSRPFLQMAGHDLVLENHQLTGPVLYNDEGKEFVFTVGENGWDILESGPVRAVVRCKGRHVATDGTSWFDGVLTVTSYALNSTLTFDHQIINTETDTRPLHDGLALTNEQAGLKYDTDFPVQMVHGLDFKVTLPAREGKKRMCTSSFNPKIERAEGPHPLHVQVGADTIIETPNEMFPEVMFSVFGCDWETESFGLCASIHQAYQNFPKAIDAQDDAITLSLFPRNHVPIAIPQGVGKTSRFQLYFHATGFSDPLLIDHLLRQEMPPVGSVAVESYIESGVYAPFVSDQLHYPTERFLYRFIDSRAKGLGFLHFGDGPEWEYVKQGRSKGKDIWINNEYDMPHNFMVMFARTGDRRYYDYFLAAVRHWLDVDLCHYSERPYHRGLLYTHSIDHVSGQPVPSHQWVEGFLDYYHATADPMGLEIARTIGSELRKMIDLPLYKKPGFVEPRELGWTLRTFLALYAETHEKAYLDVCEPIVETYCQWADQYGTWTSPYPDNYMDRVPFMIHVGIVGLYRYYSYRSSERLYSVLCKVIDDVRAECLHPQTNMFMGKQHPSIRYQNLNGMVLETMAIGYELTGDVSYLRDALGMFSWITVENPPPIYDFSKVKRDDFTVIYNCPVGPKRCAQSLLPLLHYYAAGMKEKLLNFAY